MVIGQIPMHGIKLHMRAIDIHSSNRCKRIRHQLYEICLNVEGYLDNLLRATSVLYPAGPPFEGLNALIMPKRDL